MKGEREKGIVRIEWNHKIERERIESRDYLLAIAFLVTFIL